MRVSHHGGGPSRLAKTLVPRRTLQSNSRVFKVSEEVRAAVNEKRPVVSLESTIYTHGFPYPDNLQLATRLESLVRHNGVIPAHCALLDGVATVGLQNDEMQRLLEDRTARKVSRRDLAPVLGSAFTGKGLNGGTTIASTMILSHLAGIKVFATGGLGGVHRGFENSMDVSADLTEFGRTPVAVISAGCKGFLDIPRTLEYLETEGATVGTFADGREGPVKFPAFWSRESQSLSPLTVKDEREAAAMIHAQHLLGLTSGLFFANPVPESSAIPPDQMSRIIKEALNRADRAGITGAANTPFVLNAIKEISGGASVHANRALIEANVIRGTRVAVELSRLELDVRDEVVLDGTIPKDAYSVSMSSSSLDHTSTPPLTIKGRSVRGSNQAIPGSINNSREDQPQADVAVVGSIALDLLCDYAPFTASTADITPRLHTSNPATMHHSLGGVGYNVAKAIRLAGGSSVLCSVLGNDEAAKTLDGALQADGDFQGQMLNLNHKTAQYVAVNDVDKNLVIGMADMGIFDLLPGSANQDELAQWLNIKQPKWLVADANWNPEFLSTLLREARGKGTKTAFEPVSTAKSIRLFSNLKQDQRLVYPKPLVDLATPNVLELAAMFDAAKAAGLLERQDWWDVVDALGISSTGARMEMAIATSSELVDRGVPQQSIQLLPFVPCILTKLGADGVLMTELLPTNDTRLSSPEAAPHILSRSRTDDKDVGGVYMRLFPPPEVLKGEESVSTNGVGDTFLGVLMAALTKRDGVRVEDAIEVAQRGAALTLRSKESVSPEVAKLRLSLEMS